MNSSRLWTLGSVVVIIALVLGTWAIGISPRLTEASQANETRSTVEAQNAGHELTLAKLREQFADIDKLRETLERLHVAVPKDVAQSDLVDQINALAASAGVTVKGFTFAEPSLYVPIENTEEDAELTAALASVSGGNFVVIPLDITVEGPYQNLMVFVNSLQLGDRLILVHGLNLVSGAMATDAYSELSISSQTFVLLDAALVAPPEVPAAVMEGESAEGEVPVE